MQDNSLIEKLRAFMEAEAHSCSMDFGCITPEYVYRMWGGTVMPIHRHHASSETVVVLRGKIEWVFYDDSGKETERVVLDASGEPRIINVEKDRWHSLVCLESGSVLYESKNGAYRPLEEDEIMKL